ncbi:hypothetical protein Tco_0116764, partial [Tanacetum coccineum]
MEYKFQDKEYPEDIFSFGSALEDFICVVFVPDRNIVGKAQTESNKGEVNTRVIELAKLHEHDMQDLYALLEDAHDSRTCISQRVSIDSQRALGTDGRDSPCDERHEARDGRMQAELLALRERIMAPVTRRGPNTPPNNITLESVQAMIDQALLRNSTNGDESHSSHGDNRRNVQTTRPCFYADFMKCQPLNFKGNE